MSEAMNTWIGASMSFEKEALVAYHERAIAQAKFCDADVQFPITRPVSAPLSTLRPVSLLQLLLQPAGKKTALYGSLCTHPLKSAALCTIFEDLQGRACLLRVHNLTAPDFLRKFAIGSKIVIKEPCLQSFNLGRALFVFNPADIVSLAEFPHPVVSHVNLLHHNNLRIRHRDCKAAVHQFASSLEASCTSVLDATHVNGICRKARALLDMKEYEQALELLLGALHQRSGKPSTI